MIVRLIRMVFSCFCLDAPSLRQDHPGPAMLSRAEQGERIKRHGGSLSLPVFPLVSFAGVPLPLAMPSFRQHRAHRSIPSRENTPGIVHSAVHPHTAVRTSPGSLRASTASSSPGSRTARGMAWRWFQDATVVSHQHEAFRSTG